MVQFTPNSVCFCPWDMSLLSVFLSVVLFTPNSLCVSVRGLVLSVFLSVEQFTPNSVFFCQSYISRITVCFCPWYGSRITLCVFLSMVQFSVFFCFYLFLFFCFVFLSFVQFFISKVQFQTGSKLAGPLGY